MEKLNSRQGIKPSFHDLVSRGWQDYELLDSGDYLKLERFGLVRLARFEPQATWRQALPKSEWNQVQAEFNLQKTQPQGEWKIFKPLPNDWKVVYREVTFHLEISASRHIGIFPEQQPNWDWLARTIEASNKPLTLLNLFAYSGGMTAIACRAGAAVTHVDASKNAVQRAKSNLKRSSLEDCRVRWIVDDALQFVQRELRRGRKYDGIIMDPPAFGHGPKKQVWKFEQSLPALLSACSRLLVDEPALLLLTAYNVPKKPEEINSIVLSQMHRVIKSSQYGNLTQQERSAGRKIHQAYYMRWSQFE